jgi:hypothetical protein
MLSYAAWRERFGGDESIIGKPVTIGNATFDIVGVLPRDFIYPSLFAGKPEVITESKPLPRGSTGGAFHSIVRLAPGVSREQAQARIDSAVASVAAQDRDWRDSTAVLENVRSVLYGFSPDLVVRLTVAPPRPPAAQLFKVDMHDPRTFAIAAVTVAAAALAAAYLPARRAADIDPVAALRVE